MSTTENALAQIPQNIPAHVVSLEQARAMNADAIQGISTGFPPSIRIKGSKFRIVDGNGEETGLKATDLAENEYLPIVVLAAKAGLYKTFYAAAYDPNQTEAVAPDCFSMDGITPDPSVAKPVCSTCAGCPNNAFGSGRNQAGQPTKGKACSDNKILAVAYKGLVYQFKIPPASLKNFGVYVKNLTTRGVPLGNVMTYVGFGDDNAELLRIPVPCRRWIPENAMESVSWIWRESQEVQDINSPDGLQTPRRSSLRNRSSRRPRPKNRPPARDVCRRASRRRCGSPPCSARSVQDGRDGGRSCPSLLRSRLRLPSDDEIKKALGCSKPIGRATDATGGRRYCPQSSSKGACRGRSSPFRSP
jgi:hypothetical protein